MPFFCFSTTNLKYDNVNLDELISQGTSKVAKKLGVDEKYVSLQIEEGSKKRKRSNKTDCVLIHCYITYFKELTADLDASLRGAATAFHELMKKRFHIKDHTFTITLTPHKDRVLVDWRRRNTLVDSTPIQNQQQTLCCWAYSLADFFGTSYAISNPLLTTCEQFRCAPYDLVDWVCSVTSVKELVKIYEQEGKKLRIDKYGTYPCWSGYPLDYVYEYGISLLKYYEVEIEERTLRTNRDKTEFEDMRVKKGPRIFFKACRVLKPDHNTDVLDTEAVLTFLQPGVAYGEIKVCPGCSICEGFSKFVGKSVYDEPSHPEDHKFECHGVLVLGVGNREEKDYIRVRNSHGSKWAHNGIGDVPIKFFLKIYQVSGVEKKMWDGKAKEWILLDV